MDLYTSDLLGWIQPWNAQYTHAKTGKEDEEERYSHNTKLVRVAACFRLALGSCDDDPTD